VIESVDKTDVRHTRICHVISGDLWGGAEAQALTLIRALADHADVCVVVFNRGELCSRVEESGIPVDLADEKIRGIAGLLRCVHSILGKRRPHLVHVHGFKENLVAGIAARLRGIPIVRTHHGRGMIGAGKRHTYIERLNAAFLTDGLIAVSRDLAEFLRLSGISLRNLHVIRNGVAFPDGDHRSAPETDAASPAEPGFTIGTVGRLVPVKNHKRLLEAFKRIHDEIDAARLIIVGDGPLAGELETLAAELGISSQVLFAGFQRDVRQYLRRLDVFVLSSLHEGVPISLLEAMSMGTPVVSTWVGGVPEVITDGCNGLLVESDDAEALAAAVRRIAADRRFAKMLADNARSTLSGELSFDHCLASTIALYNGMVLKQ
jgi:glycosyltransferase involved in cell wall biosynthesis